LIACRLLAPPYLDLYERLSWVGRAVVEKVGGVVDFWRYLGLCISWSWCRG